MKNTFELTNDHYRLWGCVKIYLDKYSYSPSVRELGAMMEISSTSRIHALLHDLEREGIIWQAPGKARSIVLVRLPDLNKTGQQSGAVDQG